MKVDAATGASVPLFDAAKMEAALAKLPGVAAATRGALARSRDLVFNHDFTRRSSRSRTICTSTSSPADRAVRLTSAPGDEERADVQSRRLQTSRSFASNNLFVVDIGDAARNSADDATARPGF